MILECRPTRLPSLRQRNLHPVEMVQGSGWLDIKVRRIRSIGQHGASYLNLDARDSPVDDGYPIDSPSEYRIRAKCFPSLSLVPAALQPVSHFRNRGSLEIDVETEIGANRSGRSNNIHSLERRGEWCFGDTSRIPRIAVQDPFGQIIVTVAVGIREDLPVSLICKIDRRIFRVSISDLHGDLKPAIREIIGDTASLEISLKFKFKDCFRARRENRRSRKRANIGVWQQNARVILIVERGEDGGAPNDIGPIRTLRVAKCSHRDIEVIDTGIHRTRGQSRPLDHVRPEEAQLNESIFIPTIPVHLGELET